MQAGCGFFCQPDRRAYARTNGRQGMAGMKAAMDDQSVAQRVLDHIANGTTDVGREVWREPVVNYRSEQRLTAEIEQVLRRKPTPFRSSSCAAPTVKSARFATPAGIAACRSRVDRVAPGPSSAATTAGPI